jgi:DNA-binding transcriptional ArsR family regulator
VVDLLQVIAEPRRRAILRLIWDEEKTAGDIAREFDVTFGAVSQHLALLRKAAVVDVRRDGQHRFYRANKRSLGPLANYLTALWTGHLRDLKVAAEAEEKRHGRK